MIAYKIREAFACPVRGVLFEQAQIPEPGDSFSLNFYTQGNL